jgi:ectonucleotide pyrophosphatase/phosphodiesterase family member 5
VSASCNHSTDAWSLDRRTFLRGGLAVTGGLVAGAAPWGVWAQAAESDDDHVRVYVIVVDGLRPDQVASMPTVASLAGSGVFFPESRAQMVAETTPNHLSMLTGMRVDRHGMPGNAVPGLAGRVSDDRRYLKADTLFTLMARQAPDLVSAAVTAKDYIVESTKHDRTGDGEEDATSTNDPVVSVPASDSALDVETGSEALRVSRELDPDFLFVNLGDVDRAGHVDASGGLFSGTPLTGTQPAFQALALAEADTQVRLLVEELQASGRWERTVFIVTADHSMDWSFPDRLIDLAGEFNEDDLLADEVITAVNGGACLYALRSPDDPQAQERLRRMREIAVATDGVRDAFYIRPNPLDGEDDHWVGRLHPDWGLGGDYTGDLIVTVEPGWRIGHGGFNSNPIPGNHGHPTTLRIPMIVAGGWSGLQPATTVEPEGPTGLTDRPANQGQNIDIGPTVAWLLGLHPPPGGFDGTVLPAFERRPSPRVTVANVQSMPVIDRIGGPDAIDTAVAIAQLGFPDGLAAGGPVAQIPTTTGNEELDDVVTQVSGSDTTTVVVASVDTPDLAAAGGVLAGRLGGPLLLSGPASLASAAADEITRLDPDRVLLVGGDAILSDQVLSDIDALGPTVERLDAVDPAEVYAAAAAIAGVTDGNRQVVLLDPSDNNVAAHVQVVAIRRARPLLIAGTDLPAATSQALTDLDVNRILIAGAGVSPTIEAALRDDALVERIAGDGGETARLLAERGVREGALTDDIHIAMDPLVAAAAGPAVARVGGSLLLVPAVASNPTGLARWLRDRADQFVRIRFLGDVAPATEEWIIDLIEERRTRGGDLDDPALPAPDPAPDGAPDRPELPVTGGAPAILGLAALGAAGLLRLRGRRATDLD